MSDFLPTMIRKKLNVLMMNKTEKITFRADEQYKKMLSHYAELQGISTGQLIRNWIDVIVKNQVLNSSMHVYELQDGRQFPDMKSLCNELKISSHTARKKIKNGVIQKVAIDESHAKKYGNEIHAASSSQAEENRFSV